MNSETLDRDFKLRLCKTLDRDLKDRQQQHLPVVEGLVLGQDVFLVISLYAVSQLTVWQAVASLRPLHLFHLLVETLVRYSHLLLLLLGERILICIHHHVTGTIVVYTGL